MELFIRIVNGEPFEHPIMGDNFRKAFPDVDTNNLPAEFAKFERIEKPSLVYATLNNPEPTYQWIDGVVKDVWSVTQMTLQEISDKQNATKAAWANHRFKSWVFNEATCVFEAPTPKPNDEKYYRWNEEQLAWVEIS